MTVIRSVSQEAAIALDDDCTKHHSDVDVLIERLRSSEQTSHDRSCAAWSLGRIGAKSRDIVPLLLEHLTGEMAVSVRVAQHCLADKYWKCRMHGLVLGERLLKRQPDLLFDASNRASRE